MSLVLDEHREYLTDRIRVDAFRRAIHALVRPGDVVVDLGCGTGILGVMACEAGASRVYAIDRGGMLEIARSIARANGFADRITHVAGHSTQVTLPELGDVLVFDQIGRFGFEAGMLEFALDARRRLLKPGASMLPLSVDLSLALAESPALREQIEFWNERPGGIDCSPAFQTACNTGYPIGPDDCALASAAARVVTLNPSTWTDDAPVEGSVEIVASRDATIDGLAGWFNAELAPDVFLTNAPSDPKRMSRRIAFLPLERPMRVAAGEKLTVRITLLGADLILTWQVARADGSDRQIQSTWRGMLPTREEVDRTRPDAMPSLTPRGQARKTVLELCDGRFPVSAIEAAVRREHPTLFATPRDAAVFVAEVVAVYATV